MNDDILSKLDEVKAAIVASSIPFEYRFLDTEGVAGMLGVSVSHFRNRIAPKPGFPAAHRFTGGFARWSAQEVHEWAAKQTNRAA